MVDLDDFRGFEVALARFNASEDAAIREVCESEFKQQDCTRIEFVAKTEATYEYNPEVLYLNFNYVKSIERELEQSFGKLALNILNLESILFGSTATSFLLTLFHVLKRIFKLKWRKAYRVIVFLICLIGFLVHNYLVFSEILYGELIDNGFFELIENFQMPKVWKIDFD